MIISTANFSLFVFSKQFDCDWSGYYSTHLHDCHWFLLCL